MLRIEEDMMGRHDFLLTSCSREMFRMLHGEGQPYQGCFGNLSARYKPIAYEVGP